MGIDPARISNELGWKPRETFETGLRKTVEWCLSNRPGWQRIRSGVYRGERLGVPA
jgi:dTDP-glucose 4,6-dehydratase